MSLPPPTLSPVCTLHVETHKPRDMGTAPNGVRKIIPIAGGRVTGPKIAGQIVGVGADWQVVSGEQVAQLDARYALETEDGAVIEIATFGYRHGPSDIIAALGRGETPDPADYYMRLHVRLETGDPRYAWVNRTVFLGTGARVAGGVEIAIFTVE